MEDNDRLRVDVGLKFWLQSFFKSFFILWRDFVAILIKLLWWGYTLDDENFLGIDEILWITIKNVTSVLAIISLESPSDSLTDGVSIESCIFTVFTYETFDFFFNVNKSKIFIRVAIKSDNDWLFNSFWSVFFISPSTIFFGWLFFSIFFWRSFLLVIFLFIKELLACFLSKSSSLFRCFNSLSLDLLDFNFPGGFSLVIIVLFFLIPRCKVGKKSFHVDVRNVVMFGHLLSEECLSTARWS